MTIYDTMGQAPAATGDTLEFDWSGPFVSGGIGAGKTDGPAVAAVQLRAEYALLSAAYRETTRRYEQLRAAAQAAVIEARSSRRNPVTPVAEALAELDALPAPGARLADLPLSTTAVWPRGSGAGS